MRAYLIGSQKILSNSISGNDILSLTYTHYIILRHSRHLLETFFNQLETTDVLPLAVWGLWGPWSACSKRKYCQEGQQHRRRVCLSLEDSAHCVGVSMEARDCPAAACVHACKLQCTFA